MNKIGEYGNPKIAIVIPYRKGGIKKAEQAAKIQHSRAGIPCVVYYIEDSDEKGWISVHNKAFKTLEFDYYIYSCDDYFPGRSYVRIAYESMIKHNKKVCVFNDGKWNGLMATAAIVEKNFILSVKELEGNLFYPGYKQNYGDPEMTDIALHYNEYLYNPNAVFIENDYDKDGKSVNLEDKKLYMERKVPWTKRFK